MMNKDKKDKFLDDVSRMAGGVVTMMSGATKQIKGEVKNRVDDWGHKMDFVPREDFERLEAVVQALSKKVANLESRKTSKAKPAVKKRTTTAKKKTSQKVAVKKTPSTKKKLPAKKTDVKKVATKSKLKTTVKKKKATTKTLASQKKAATKTKVSKK